jgi:hypothetical protein
VKREVGEKLKEINHLLEDSTFVINLSFGLTAKLAPKASEDIFLLSIPFLASFNKFLEMSNEQVSAPTVPLAVI